MHDDEIPTVPCPYCKAEILEDAERCPRCENYLSAEDAPAGSSKPLWIWVLLIVATLLMVASAFM
jgi:predicted amidophosphoribosyltransferase